MKTFKRLGMRMYRAETGGWRISSKDLSYEGQGNKGIVMADALRSWSVDGYVIFSNGHWERVRHETEQKG
jgi:hypothetical protein